MIKTKIFLLSSVLGLLSLVAQAQDSFNWTTNSGAITITGYTGTDSSVTIPAVINGYPVTTIGDWAFYRNSVTNVTIPDSVTYIGYAAFNGSALKSVIIPDSVTALNSYAFYDCGSLANVVLSTNLTSIGSSAFGYNWSLTSITIPASVTSLGDEVFRSDMSLTNVTFLGNAPALGGTNLFMFNTTVKVYYYYPSTGWESTFAGAPVYELNTPFGYSINNGGITITSYNSTNSAVRIPAGIDGYPVVNIALSAFYSNSAIRSLVMPDTITSFASGSLQSRVITAPGGGGWAWEYWYSGAFASCTNLTNLVLSSSLTSISAGAFYGCSNLTSITIPSGVTYLGNVAFYGCTKLTNATFLGNAPSAANEGVSYADPNLVFWGAPVTIYYYYPGTGWGTSYLSKPTVELGLPFTYTVTNGVATVTGYFGTNSAPVALDDINGYPIVAIGANAFANSNVRSVIVSSSVTNFAASAFSGCSSLTNMMFIGSPPALGSGVFNNANSLTVYYYSDVPGWAATFGRRPTGAMLPYTYTTNNNAITITGHLGTGVALTVPSSINSYPVVKIGDYAFANGNLTSISLPNSLTNIGNRAFNNCYSLANIVLPSNLTGIGQYAFAGSLSGAHVTIPNSMTSIGERAFMYCGMSSVTIPNSVTTIGAFAFESCALGSVTIPGSVATLGYGAFKQCFNLSSVVVLNGVTGISAEAFFQCEVLTSVTLPDSLTHIGVLAFYGTQLTRLVIPNNVTSIDASAFSHCFGLTEVVLPASLTAIGEDAFFNCSSLTNLIFQGNAPGNQYWWGNTGVPMTVSYYYGARGWSTNSPDLGWYLTESGVTLVELEWSPLPMGVGVQGGNFGFNFVNTNCLPVVVEASTNLVNWQPVWTNAFNANSTNFVDPQWTNHPNRFYRTR